MLMIHFFFLFIDIHIYSLKNYLNTYSKEIKSIKSGTQKKQSLDINLFGISRKQQKRKIKIKKGDVSL